MLEKSALAILLTVGMLVSVHADDARAGTVAQLPALWAVVVGVSDYKFLPPSGTAAAPLTDLNFAARDAEAFAAFLKRQEATGAYRQVSVQLFSDSQATKEDVITAVEDGLVEARNDDLVIIYFAGHGVPDAAGAEYLLLWDSRQDRLSATAYRMNDLWTRLKDRIRAEKAVVILDACHAGALGNAGNTGNARGSGTNAASSFQRYLSDARGRALLAATREGQSAYEDPASGHGYFTQILLEGLEKTSSDAPADFNKDGVVLLNEAFDYVYDRVKRITDGKQLPDIKGDVTGLLPLAVTSSREKLLPAASLSPLLVVTTSPVRARIFLQGPDGAMEDMGVAPVLRKVLSGRYTVVALAEGYCDADKTVDVEQGEVPVRLTLSARREPDRRAWDHPASAARASQGVTLDVEGTSSGQEAVRDADGASGGSGGGSAPDFEGVSSAQEAMLDFEGVSSGEKADSYLRDRGVTIEKISRGTALYILSEQKIYEGAACKATSGENILTQNGSNDPVAFTLRFDRPCTSVSFTRPKLLTGPSGITHPEWKARAYDREGREVDSAEEELIRSYFDVPAARFTLRGGKAGLPVRRLISTVTFSSINGHFAAFSALLIDDISLQY